MPRITPGPPCVICKSPSIARGFCRLHYERWKSTGDPNGTKRPKDWGDRVRHPLFETWASTRRLRPGRVAAWDDFWTFVADVGERPSPTHALKRRDSKAHYSPENCYWAPVKRGADARADWAAWMRAYRKRSPERFKGYDLKKQYGITLQDYDAMLAAQNDGCAICGRGAMKFRLAVDHCHATGNVRELLCVDCNTGLGRFEDSPERLEAAAAYLRKHQSRKAA